AVVAAIAELPIAAVAPALDPARARHRAGLAVAGGDRGRGHPSPERNVDRDEAVGVAAVAEFAGLVGAPALDPAPARHRTGLVGAGGDRGRGHTSSEQYVDLNIAVAVAAVAEFPVLVVAPALGPAPARQRAGLAAADGDRGRGRGCPGRNAE